MCCSIVARGVPECKGYPSPIRSTSFHSSTRSTRMQGVQDVARVVSRNSSTRSTRTQGGLSKEQPAGPVQWRKQSTPLVPLPLDLKE